MTELRKGQRVWVEAEVGVPHTDDGKVLVWLSDIDNGPQHGLVDLHTVRTERDVYLARREAMVGKLVDRQTVGELTVSASPEDLIVEAADKLLRAIDETPVPGGEHE